MTLFIYLIILNHVKLGGLVTFIKHLTSNQKMIIDVSFECAGNCVSYR